MARYLGVVVVGVFCIVLILVVLGCASTEASQEAVEPTIDDDLRSCDDDCIQPPLLQEELVPYLQEHQERILGREAYKNDLPPPISEIILGPVIDDVVRGGPQIVDADGAPFDGEVDWHFVEFEPVTTQNVEAPPQLRGRQVSGAHCFFARKPNSRTTIFAVLAVHGEGSDALYLGGPNHRPASLDTAAMSRAHPGSIRLSEEGLRCAFRHDQNLVGAVVIPVEYSGSSAPEKAHYAVYVVSPDTEAQPTGKTVRVERSLGLWIQEVTREIEIPLREYDEPWTNFLGVYDELHEAMEVADEELLELTDGRFRLRPEFVYSALPWKAYFSTGKEEFCPQYVECHIPSKYLNIEEFAPLSPEFMRLMAELWASQNAEETQGDEEEEEQEDKR